MGHPRRQGKSEGQRALPRRSRSDYSHLVSEEKDDGGEGEPGGQGVAPEEVEGDPRPAADSRDESAADIRHGHSGGERRGMEVAQPVDFGEASDDDEELDRDADLSPAFSGHGKIVAGGAAGQRRGADAGRGGSTSSRRRRAGLPGEG